MKGGEYEKMQPRDGETKNNLELGLMSLFKWARIEGHTECELCATAENLSSVWNLMFLRYMKRSMGLLMAC